MPAKQSFVIPFLMVVIIGLLGGYLAWNMGTKPRNDAELQATLNKLHTLLGQTQRDVGELKEFWATIPSRLNEEAAPVREPLDVTDEENDATTEILHLLKEIDQRLSVGLAQLDRNLIPQGVTIPQNEGALLEIVQQFRVDEQAATEAIFSWTPRQVYAAYGVPDSCSDRGKVSTAWLNRQTAGSVWTTSITIFEIGLHRLPDGKRRVRLETAFSEMIREDLGGRVLPFDTQSALAAGALSAALQAQGNTVEIREVQIAGIARARQALLATRNAKHFDQACDVINPWEDA